MVFWKNRLFIQLIAFALFFLFVIFLEKPDGNLHIIACSVGQGDAVLVVYKDIQILTDGGPNNSVLECLGRFIPFWDREIELVVLTHPQKDHYGGLTEVFKRYRVDNYLYNQLDIGSQEYQLLENRVRGGGAKTIDPITASGIRLGLIHLDILHPKEKENNSDINEYSIVSLFRFRDFKAVLTGDAAQEISDEIAEKWQMGSVDYIKVPHHGSRNGLSENLLGALAPKVAVISVGKNNSYGHPHKEIIEMLEKYKVKILRTDEMGDIEVITDGEKIWIKK